MIREVGQHVGKPSLRVDVIELGGGDEAVDGSRAPAAIVGPSEGPIFSTHGDRPQLTLGSIVRHAKPSVVEEAAKCIPAAEAVIDCFGRVVVPGEPGTPLAQPRRQLDDQGAATLLANPQTLLRRKAVNVPLD